DDRVKGVGRMLCTGPGDDRVKGGRGGKADLGPGNDVAEVGSVDVTAGAGRDQVMIRNAWRNTVHGGRGNDRIRVSGERITIHGGAGADHIRNSAERAAGSTYFGGPGPDRIVGGQGPELFRG